MIDMIEDNDHRYTIIATHLYYGQMIVSKNKEEVRETCEKIRKGFELSKDTENTHMRIEVVNNDTGEIREYWNNHDNTIQF